MIVLNTPASIFAAIQACAATSSKKEKENIVAAIMGVPLGLKVLVAAYDPFRIYGIGKTAVPKKTPGIAPGANTLLEDMAWNTLIGLANRALTGDAARQQVQNTIDFLDEPSSELFRRILMKDMRAGFTDGTMNRVRKGTIAEFPYMRCTSPAKSNMPSWDWSVGIIVQEKADGMFANVNWDGKVLSAHSRQGTEIPLENLPELAVAMRAALIPSTQTHGELLIFRDGVVLNREDSNGVMSHINQGGSLAENEQIRFYAWDQIPLSEVKPKGEYKVGYKERFVQLLKARQSTPGVGLVQVIPTKIVKSKDEAWAYYRTLLLQGKEGVICKHPNASWKDTGTGHKDVVKLKLKAPAEYRVEGFNFGTGKNEGKASSLKVRTECGQMRFNVTCRGDAMIEDVTKNFDTNWADAIVTVEGNSIQEPGDSNEYHALYLPVFVEKRTDRTEADTLERVREQFQAAMENA
jgi:DNA ligase 1